MNLRRVAALAIMGWCLIMPPDFPSKEKPLPPLAQWKVQQTFDTADQCERELAKELADLRTAREAANAQAERASERSQGGIGYGAFVVSKDEYQKCVASDDPRLTK